MKDTEVGKMERFVPGRRYLITDEWGHSLDKTILCTRRTASFVYFAKNSWGEEWRRKARVSYGEERVELDQGYASLVKGIRNGVKEIRAKNVMG